MFCFCPNSQKHDPPPVFNGDERERKGDGDGEMKGGQVAFFLLSFKDSSQKKKKNIIHVSKDFA